MIPLLISILLAGAAPHMPAGGRIVTTPDLHVGIRPHVEASPGRISSLGVTVQVTIRGL